MYVLRSSLTPLDAFYHTSPQTVPSHHFYSNGDCVVVYPNRVASNDRCYMCAMTSFVKILRLT